jgi:Asparagine synthase
VTSAPSRGDDRFWAAFMGEPGRIATRLGAPDISHRAGDSRALSIWLGQQATRVRVAQDETRLVLVEGRPDNLNDHDPAEAILRAPPGRRIPVFQTLNAPLSVVVRDAEEEALLCIRDPLGVQPLFYRDDEEGFLISPSPELIARSGRETAALDRLALAEWVTSYITPVTRTLYSGIRRLPPGHSVLVGRRADEPVRYWLPDTAKPDERLDDDAAVAHFDLAFDQATERLAAGGRCAVFLSGGVDSSLTAAAVAQHHRAHGLEPPLALSLKFPHKSEDEEERARAVASALELPHRVIPLAEAMGGLGILSAGIEASRHSWYPSPNPWSCAYEYLARVAAESGCRMALNGEGGNDLLETPWELAADMIRGGELRGLRRFARAQSRYYGGSPHDYLRDLLWNRGLVALARPVARRSLVALTPATALRIRRERAQRTFPPWALPDEELRDQVVDHRLSLPRPLSSKDLHGFTRRQFLDAPFTSIMLEGIYLGSHRSRIEIASVYLDPELFELVLALPARTLQVGDRAKGLAYASFARRADSRIADTLKPATAETTARGALVDEADGVIQALGGLPRLSALGIVSERKALAVCTSDATKRGNGAPESWHLLSTEAWLQSREL